MARGGPIPTGDGGGSIPYVPPLTGTPTPTPTAFMGPARRVPLVVSAVPQQFQGAEAPVKTGIPDPPILLFDVVA